MDIDELFREMDIAYKKFNREVKELEEKRPKTIAEKFKQAKKQSGW